MFMQVQNPVQPSVIRAPLNSQYGIYPNVVGTHHTVTPLGPRGYQYGAHMDQRTQQQPPVAAMHDGLRQDSSVPTTVYNAVPQVNHASQPPSPPILSLGRKRTHKTPDENVVSSGVGHKRRSPSSASCDPVIDLVNTPEGPDPTLCSNDKPVSPPNEQTCTASC